MIKFRKIYYQIKKEDYGSYVDSIIVYEKRAVAYSTRVLKPDEVIKKGYNVETVDTHFKHFLQIDLWLIILRFNWESNTL